MRMTRFSSLFAAATLSTLLLSFALAPFASAQVVAAQTTPPAAAPPSATPPVRPAATPAPPAPPSAHREYLQRLVIVLDGLRRTLRWVEMHPGNEPLARFSLPLAQAYVTMTGHMTPTEDLRLLHPHLLLIAENTECAIAAQGGGDVRGYRSHLRTVRDEMRTLQSVLHHLEIELPEIPR